MKERISTFLKRIWTIINKPEMLLLPGQLAYFLVLTIIPTLTLISYMASSLNIPTDYLYNFISKAFSSDMASLLLNNSMESNGIPLIILFCVFYYIASSGTNSIIVTSNTIYGIPNGNWFKRRLKAIVMLLIITILMVVLLIFPIFGTKIIELICRIITDQNIIDLIYQIYNLVVGPLMWVMLFIFIKIIYGIAPDKKIDNHNTTYGSLFTTISWILVTYLYSFYVNNLADYSTVYGGLATVSILMVWFYLISFFLVIGMSLNYQKESENNNKNKRIKNKR